MNGRRHGLSHRCEWRVRCNDHVPASHVYKPTSEPSAETVRGPSSWREDDERIFFETSWLCRVFYPAPICHTTTAVARTRSIFRRYLFRAGQPVGIKGLLVSPLSKSLLVSPLALFVRHGHHREVAIETVFHPAQTLCLL
jgi:hypothetical protein